MRFFRGAGFEQKHSYLRGIFTQPGMKKHEKNIKKTSKNMKKTHPKSSKQHQNYKKNMTQNMRTFLKKDDEKRMALHSMLYRKCLFS